MDFARKQLEKYGWSDGKGLGKFENGISQPLKPKLKRSVTGMGYDAAADFTEHWWSALYDKAASNIQVEEKNGKTKKIKTKDNTELEITNSTWKLKKKKKSDQKKETELYVDYFVKTAILDSGGVKVERVGEESETDSEEERMQNGSVLTDEELFAACGGRTAHKGARHGLKALGKLARIAQQEQLLLQQVKFNGYSHAKNLNKNRETEEVVEDTNFHSSDGPVAKKKKKKKKHCTKHEGSSENGETNGYTSTAAVENDENMEQISNCDEHISRSKKKKHKVQEFVKDEDDCDFFEDIIKMALETPPLRAKKKKKVESMDNDSASENNGNTKLKRKEILYDADSEDILKHKKKKKNSSN